MKVQKETDNNTTGSQISSLFTILSLLMLVVSGCATNETSDAYGQFEATETTISSEMSGKLLQFNATEGDNIRADQQVGYVDSTRLSLQKKELEAQLESIRARITNINAEVEVQQAELSLAETNLNRLQALQKDGATTQQKLDDAQGRVRTIQKRIDALQTQKQSVRAEINATQARIDQINDQIEDALIINAVNGTVLTTFVEPYELVQRGQPLYRIANLDTLILRVYVDGAQLPSIKLGQQVEVLVDKNAEENQSMAGRVSWIASEAEFTPEQIQTKEERVTQVYAVKVRVPNSNGILKIGMPGEVNF
ncbi:HlyD family secretion protein [Halalkalibaculum sp. DA3122]|uniref:HlyD family secretion protein n=1 Tax=Halalkalibaculum sp. DA3122 TaxID=3373607 RepID=UPI003754C2E0